MRSLALNRQEGHVPGRFNQREIIVRRHAALGRVDRECPEDLVLFGQDRLRPASAYPECQCEVAVRVEPDRLLFDGGHDDSRLDSRGGFAQARVWIDQHRSISTRPLFMYLRTGKQTESYTNRIHLEHRSY